MDRGCYPSEVPSDQWESGGQWESEVQWER